MYFKQSVFLANKHVLARQNKDENYIVEFRKEKRNGHWFDRAFCLAISEWIFAPILDFKSLGIANFIKLHFKEGKQKCLLQLPFFILQGYYCCSSLAQGLVIKQKALLLALVMQLTWQLYLWA